MHKPVLPPQPTSTEFLVAGERQITAPHLPGVAPLPPVRSAARLIWDNFGRIAPGLATTATSVLAWMWHEQLPEGSTLPLWTMGLLAAVTAAVGTVAAAKKHGDRETARLSLAGTVTLAVTGVAAWTPDSALRLLLWLLSTAVVYAVCAFLWREDRKEARTHTHQQTLARIHGQTAENVESIRQQGHVEGKLVEYKTAVDSAAQVTASIERIAAASEARATRALRPGDELNVDALLSAAGMQPRAALEPARLDDEEDLEALLRITRPGPYEPSAAERQGQAR
ncbi:hypothetical protein [Streptomyces sp. BH105]|uniref:hypothetical protein n=1 Tax=Streptomyces sp. BH105 TaxID=3410408 RepID=UPI003CF501D7